MLSFSLQLESALKAAEAAQASLHAERVNPRARLFTEEEFKSLQLQVTFYQKLQWTSFLCAFVLLSTILQMGEPLYVLSLPKPLGC